MPLLTWLRYLTVAADDLVTLGVTVAAAVLVTLGVTVAPADLVTLGVIDAVAELVTLVYCCRCRLGFAGYLLPLLTWLR